MRQLIFAVLATTTLAHAAAPPAGGPTPLTPDQQRRLQAIEAKQAEAEAKEDFEAAERLAREAVASREKWQGARHWETIDARYRVEVWQRLARVPREQRAEVWRARRLNDEGVVQHDRGQFREGLAKLHEALGIDLKTLGEQHPDTAQSYNNMAHCLHSLGRSGEALQLHQKALGIRQRTLGELHHSTAKSYNNMAHCLQSLGRVGEALPLYQKALGICQKTLGELHPTTAKSYNNVASCLQSLGRAGEALPPYQKALGIFQKTLGELHPYTADSYNNVAFCLQSLGRADVALPLCQKALGIRQKALGELHPSTAGSYFNVANCLYRLGRAVEALPLHQKALGIRQKTLGEHHPDTAGSNNNVAFCLQSLGRAGEALPLHQKALGICLKTLGEHHPDSANCYDGMSHCLQALGRKGEALPLYQKALGIRLKALGELHPDTADSYNNVANCLLSLGRAGEALPLYQKALGIRLKVLGELHLATAGNYNKLANCLESLGRSGEALPLHEKALGICLKVLGELHPSTAGSYNNVATCLESLGRSGEALPLHEKTLGICLKTLGERHRLTAISNDGMAHCLKALGRAGEAVILTQASLRGREASRALTSTSGFDRSVAQRTTSPDAVLALLLPRYRQPRNAWRHAEASLGRALLDDLAREEPEDRRRLDALSARLATLDAQVTRLYGSQHLSAEQQARRDALVVQRRRLEDQRADLLGEASRRRVATLEQVQAALPADAALVLWVEWGKGEAMACVLRQAGDPEWVQVPTQGKAWAEADTFLATQAYTALLADRLGAQERAAFLGRQPAGLKHQAEEALDATKADDFLAALRRQRVAPLLPHLKGVRRLFVVPTGAMAAVPVELLFPPEFSVSLIPSGTLLRRVLTGHRPLEGTSLLALGDPAFTPPGHKAPPPPEHGLYVAGVVAGGAGEKAGLRVGDVLLKRGDVELLSMADAGKSTSGVFTLWSAGKERAVKLPPGPLGISIARDPPRVAERKRREMDALVSRGTEHAPLPGSAHEVNALARLVPHTSRLLGSDASEQALDELVSTKRLRGYRILHLATHGEVNELAPDNTCLVLAQDRLPDAAAQVASGRKVYDGRLTVQTVRRTWDLDADLVVLSACQTGLGRNSRGDGLLGFAQALLSRGARTVVLSRWKVDDAATGLLMVRFYENLLKRKLPRLASLNEAKRWLREMPRAEAEKRVAALTGGTLRGSEDELPPLAKGETRPVLPTGDRPYAHPFYWAAWMLVGDPD